MTNKDWKEQFKQEFGIHFSDSEFSFAISFIESLLKSKQEEIEYLCNKAEGENLMIPPQLLRNIFTK